MLTVGELLRMPHLRLSLYSGGAGLSRAVAWVHISDLPRPWEWLAEDELLLTNGLNLPARPEDQPALLDGLHDAGAAGLAVGTDTPSPPLGRELARRADELGLPVLLVPYSVPFSTIVKAAAEAGRGEESRRLARVARVYELLRVGVGRGQPRQTILRRLGDELGCRFSLVDPELGRPLVADDDQPEVAAQLARVYDEQDGILPGVVHLGDHGRRAVAVPVPGDHPAVLVAVASGFRLPELDLLGHVATVAALELAGLHAERERRRRVGAELLARLVDGQLTEPAAAAQLRGFGLEADRGCLLALSRRGSSDGDTLHHQLARHGLPHLLLQRSTVLLAMVPSDRGTVGRVADVLGRAGGRVGVSSDLTAATRAPAASREALFALGVAESEGRRVVHFSGENSLLLPRSLTEAQVVVSRILGPVLAYDDDHSSELLPTLRAVLEADRSWNRASQKLHVHRQTLGYRIRKIEQLTGRTLRSTRDIAELWFALRAHDLIQGRAVEAG